VSLYPCEDCKRRVPGALESARVTVLSGSAKYSRRMRLCAQHLNGLLENGLLGWEAIGDEGPVSDSSVCRSPGHTAAGEDGPCSGFAWAYRRGEAPLELYAPLCEAHALELINARALREEPILV
jgi:hypothetical protein